MDRVFLNEHDAQQGAQSNGEFLGMTGNSGWYLLGSVAASLISVILFWGVLGVSLLACLLFGVVLCSLSVAYVFALKNNKPEHYDTDFFESALIEAGMMELSWGPRARRPANPFVGATASGQMAAAASSRRQQSQTRAARANAGSHTATPARPQPEQFSPEVKRFGKPVREEPVVALAAYENLRDELDTAEQLLEDALVEREEV